jgi:hypothetical protein
MTQTEREDGLRELDAWIAEHIMGITPHQHGGFLYRKPPPYSSPVDVLPYYSSDISAAHQMETRIKELGLAGLYVKALKETLMATAESDDEFFTTFNLIHASASERCRAARML